MSAEKNFFAIRPKSRSMSTRWYVEFTVEGKRIRRFGNINHFNTEEQRLEAAKKLIVQLTLEFQFAVHPIQDRLLDEIEKLKPNYRAKTYQTYISKIKIFNSWIGEKGITEESVQAFFHYLNCNKANATYMKYLDLLRMLFKRLGIDSLLENIESLTVRSTSALYFQQYQIKRLKNVISESDPELWLCCQLLYYCFIRPGEQRQMKISDFLFDDWKIRMRGEITKNRRTQLVTIPDAFRADIEKLQERNPGEWLFPSLLDESKPVGVNQLSSRHRKVLRSLGFSLDHKLYSWKHTGAIACVKANISVKDLQIQLRHSSLQQTGEYLKQLDVYDLQRLEADFPAL